MISKKSLKLTDVITELKNLQRSWRVERDGCNEDARTLSFNLGYIRGNCADRLTGIIEQLESVAMDNETLQKDLAEADRRAGAAERENEQLRKTIQASRDWIEEAKDEAGYSRNVSFDVVWEETLAKARQAEVDVDDLAQFIRQVDGDHTLGAGELAERIVVWLGRAPMARNG